jgi:signal peptidase II
VPRTGSGVTRDDVFRGDERGSASETAPGGLRGSLEQLERRPGPVAIGMLVAAIGYVLDQATKHLAYVHLAGGEVIDLPGPFFLHLARNPGAAFGLGLPWWAFPIVTGVVVAFVMAYLPNATSAFETFAYGLLLAGALGNMTDRLVRPHPDGWGRGEVVDFIGVTFWPTFNVADICISLGFVFVVIAVLVHWQHERQGGLPPHRTRPDRA